MKKRLECDELKERVAALEKENRQLREGPGRTEVLFDSEQIEEKLCRSEEKCRIIADFTYDWEMWLSPSGDYLYISPSCERITGYLAEEFMTDPGLFWRILHPDDLARVEKHYRDQAEDTGQIHSIDFRLIHRSGEERWINHHCQPAYGRDMRFLGRRVSNADITDRMRAENVLRGREEKYRTLFEMESDAILLVDDETMQILDANAAAVALFQYSREELRARTVLDVSAEPEKTLQVIRQRVSRVHPRWLLKKDGTRFPGEITRRLFEWQGRQAHLAAIRDTSERLAAEKELKETRDLLRSVLDNAPALIYVNSADHRYRLVNKSWERFAGRTGQQAMGRTPQELFSARTAREFEKFNQRVVETGATVTYEESFLRNGKRFFFHTIKFPLIGSDGEIGGISVDISDLKRAEGVLLETREQLFQAQKMETLGTLVAGVAHEINNPISLVLFNAPLLRRIWSDLQPVIERHADVEHQRKYAGLSYEYLKNNLDRLLADMELAGNRIAAIVNHLKEFARKSDISEKNLMSLNEAVENALGFSQMSFRKAGVRLNVVLGTDLPSMIGNMQRIEQIVLNFLVNAVQAIKHKQGLIEIKTSHDESRDGVTLSVSDNGEGIDPSISGRIFDPFYTTRQGEGGTGLGLSVTYSLVREHHGRITYESEVGKGTTFNVFFPLGAEKKRFNVLVADDETSFLEILKHAFGKLSSFDLEIAQDGMDALIKIGTFHPDILIVDLMMPGMDGLELCRKLRESPELAQTEVVVVTGFWEDPKLETIRELGFTRIYRKPLDLEAFVKEIEKMV